MKKPYRTFGDLLELSEITHCVVFQLNFFFIINLHTFETVRAYRENYAVAAAAAGGSGGGSCAGLQLRRRRRFRV